MLTIDYEKCIQCRKCENICHTSCITVCDNNIVINNKICSTCTQCIAICPAQALCLNGAAPEKVNTDLLPKPEQMKEFLKCRRSIRKFKDKAIERDILKSLANISKYAPTNNHEMDIIIVDDKILIEQLESECISFINKMYKIFYKPKIVFGLLRRIIPSINETDKVKIERTLKRSNIFQNAPALIILLADSRIPHTELSCQYALYNISLYAQSLGIGTCISGAGKMILSKSKKIRELLTIPYNKKILGILFLGYPDVKFPNKVEGIEPKIQWNAKR